MQVYAVDATEPAERQVRHLLGFRRVQAAPGSTVDAVVVCDPTPISRRDPTTRTWSIAEGHWQLMAAQQSQDPNATAKIKLPD